MAYPFENTRNATKLNLELFKGSFDIFIHMNMKATISY